MARRRRRPFPERWSQFFGSASEYFAIDDMCPHMGASLADGFVEDGIVTCRWHYWRFRLADGAWADNPRIKIGSYPVHIVDNEIRLEIPDPKPEDRSCLGCASCSPE